MKDSSQHAGVGRALLVVVIVIVGVLVVGGIAVYRLLPDWNSRASFGDMFGAIGALFSGLGLAGVVAAILLQRQDLELQRQDLANTRSEMEQARHSADLRFVMDLAPRVSAMKEDVSNGWRMLTGVDPVSHKGLSEDETYDLVEALEGYVRAARFAYQMAVLTEAGTIDEEAFYLLYYDDFVYEPIRTLKMLGDWVETGLDLAADYDWLELLRLARATESFVQRLEAAHAAHDGDPYSFPLREVRELIETLEALGDPELWPATSA